MLSSVVVSLILAAMLSGCVPFPVSPGSTRGNLGDRDRVPDFIVPGQTTCADVLAALGEPDTASPDERTMSWGSAAAKSGIGVLLLAPGGAGGGASGAWQPVVFRRLVVTFDEQGVVAATPQFETKTCQTFPPDKPGRPENGPCLDYTGKDVTFTATDGGIVQRYGGGYANDLAWFPSFCDFSWLSLRVPNPGPVFVVLMITPKSIVFQRTEPGGAMVRIPFADIESVAFGSGHISVKKMDGSCDSFAALFHWHDANQAGALIKKFLDEARNAKEVGAVDPQPADPQTP